jgi:predicted P-loop ATPase
LKEPDRRFWPVRTTTIDIEALRRDRDQLWAEAAQRESESVSIVLDRGLWDPARIEQEAREEADPWDDILSELIGTIEQGEERVEASDLLTTVLGIHPSKQRDVDYKRCDVVCSARDGTGRRNCASVANQKGAMRGWPELRTRLNE